MNCVAALFVESGGIYFGLEGVDPWDSERDARLYKGPYPVVAHPPCSRWCRLAGLVEARWGHKKGDDDGCFEAALHAVRAYGGVLEHPAYSDAWGEFGLPRPHPLGGWQQGICGGWATQVEQGRYGHPARKATWLYAFNTATPPLDWGYSQDNQNKALVSWCRNHSREDDTRPRVGKREASATTTAFRDLLLSLARSTYTAPLQHNPL